ncbi:MAG: hypothetical protein AAF665_17005 [Pseudomonadota bacterium]
MQFNKALAAQALLHDATACDDAFSNLIAEIANVPDQQRGARALLLAARLLEAAAYELAGRLDSEQVGALIECAADLSEQSSDIDFRLPSQTAAPRKLVQ